MRQYNWTYSKCHKTVLNNFYKQFKVNKKPLEKRITGITSVSRALGDSVVIASPIESSFQQRKEYSVFTENPYLSAIMEFSPYKDLARKINTHDKGNEFIKSGDSLDDYDCGNGHIIQRLHRFVGLKPPLIPKMNLVTPAQKVKNKIALSLQTGASAWHSSRYIKHPKQIYENNLYTLESFIKKHSDWEFVEFAVNNTSLHPQDNLKPFVKHTVEETIVEMATCEFFIGVNSGLMHLAAALNIKSVTIINLPKIEECYLPILQPAPIKDLCWLYPQNVILHQDGWNELVPLFTEKTLNMALNGEIYPYFSNDYLGLIYE